VPPEKRPSSAAFQHAVREIAACVRPVSLIESGSAGKRFVGSAVVVAAGSRRVVVTAEHVVAGPEPKLVGMSTVGSVQWPTNYSRVEPVNQLVPPVDLAFFVAEVESGNPFDLLPPLPVSRFLPGEDLPAGGSVVAVGFPSSRAKSRDGHKRLHSHRLSVVGDLAPLESYARVNRSPASFLAMEFRQDGVVDEAGQPSTTAHPRGMSGGAMFAATFSADASGVRFTPRLVGILIEHHDEPDNLLVAARIECLLDATGSRHGDAAQRYRAVEV